MRAWNGWYHVNGNTYGTWLRGDPRGWRARHHREHVEGDYNHPPPPGTYERLEASSRRLMRRDEIRLSEPARKAACREMIASLLRHGVEVIALSVDDHHFHLLARFPLPGGLRHAPQAHGSGRESCLPSESSSSGEAGLQHRRRLIRGLGESESDRRLPTPRDATPPSDASAAHAAKRKDGNVILTIIRHVVGIAKKDSAQALAAARLADAGGVWAKRCRALAIRDRTHQVNVFNYIVEHAQQGAAVWTFRDAAKTHSATP